MLSRFSTLAETSKEASHEVDLYSFIRSTFDHTEGSSYCWLNRPKGSKELWKKEGAILLLAEAFLEYHRGSHIDQIAMLEKVKLLQQRYPWLHVIGFQSSPAIGSATDLHHLMQVITEEYINFPILLCNRTFPEIAGGACCLLFKDIRDPPLYHDKDVDVGILNEAIKDLKEEVDKKASNADKLKSPWAKQPEGLKEPLVSSSLRNLLLYHPACISADEDGGRIFLSDNNHHRIIVFDSTGNILDVIGSSPGFEDGDFEMAKLMRPAASYYDASEDCLYFVDSENHAIRRADMNTRLVETLYPPEKDKGKSGLWTWILDKLGIRRDTGLKSVELGPESLLFPWHLLKSRDNDLLVMNKSFDTAWIINLDKGIIHEVVTGHRKIMELCGEKIIEKVSCLKDLSKDFLQNLVSSSYPLEGVPYSGLMSSFVTVGENYLICDRVGQRVLTLNKQNGVASIIKFSNFGILGLPYWLSGSLEESFIKSHVNEELLIDHVQSFTLYPGKIDIKMAVDIPSNTELLEPLHESCVWRQARGAAKEASGLESTASASEKVGVAQQWYDELDNLAFAPEPELEVSAEEISTSSRKLEDGKIYIGCVVNTSTGTSEVTISAPLYLKLQNEVQNCKNTQEAKAAKIASILKAERGGSVSKDAFISYLLNLDTDLGELVFVKPLHVKIKLHILNHPKVEGSRDFILTDSVIHVDVSL